MGIADYKSPRVATDIILIASADKEVDNERKVPAKGLQILLIRRDEEPFNNEWTLPGGFVDIGVGISESVERKLKQKTGIENIYNEQLYTYGDDITRDPRDHVVSVAYVALTSKDKIKLNSCHGDKEAAWFWIEPTREITGDIVGVTFNRVDTNEKVRMLGFDHSKMVIDTLNRLSNKIMYTDIGFHLVNDEFTIKELQMAYEAVIGKELVGFRRVIEPKISETGRNTLDVRDKPDLHRPAKLYRKR